MSAASSGKIISVSVLIIDEHKIVRDGLSLMLASLNDAIICSVTEASGESSALQKLETAAFDLVIMAYPLSLCSSLELLYRMLRFLPGLKVIILSDEENVTAVAEFIDAGAYGYILKRVAPHTMLVAIEAVLDGRIFYCNDIALKIIDAHQVKAEREITVRSLLTPREKEILLLITMEYTNEDIARKLFLSKRTIDSHRLNLLRKLGVKNTVGLIKAAYRLHILP